MKGNSKLLIISLALLVLGILSRSIILIIFAGIGLFTIYKQNQASYPAGTNIFIVIFSDLYEELKKKYPQLNFDTFFHGIKVNKVNNNENLNISRMPLSNAGSIKKILGLVFGVIIIVILFARVIIIIPAGSVGVYNLFGKVSDRPLYSGLNFVNPLGSVEKMDARIQDYTMSIATNEGVKVGDDSIYALSKEGLSVSLDITVLYRVSQEKAPVLFKEIGQNYSEVVVRPEIRSAIREVVANYDVKEIYSEKRVEANQKLTELLKSKVEPRGIMIEEVLLRNVQLPKNLADSIELKLQAEQEAQRYDFLLTQATKEAERKRIEAAGQRDSQKIISEGLTPSYLQYLYITSLKDRQGTIYVPTNPSNGLPTFKGL